MSSTENNYQETDLGNVAPHLADEYDPEASYEYLDTVSYKGGSYACRVEDGTVTGIAPAHGKNTDTWQSLTLPGDLTPEYIAMHDDVVNKAEQVEASRAAVEQLQEEIEAAQADVQQLHSDTVEAAQEASDSRDSAAGYAQAAEISRQAAEESEQNVNTQVTGFDTHVAEKITEATQDIESARQTAVSAVTAQQESSVQAVATEGKKYTDATKTDAEVVASNKQAVEAAAQTVAAQAQKVAQNTQTVASNTESATKSAESAQTSAKNAAKSAEGVQSAVEQIGTNKKDIESLKTDMQNATESITGKISKFYASSQGDTHLADSDSEKIVDMMMYGKSEQVSTTGSQLLDLSVTPNAHRNQYVFDKTTGIYTHTVETAYDSNRWIISSNPNTDMIISCKNIENGMRIEVSRFLQNEANSTICTIDSSNKKATFNTKTWNEFTISIFGYATGKQTAEDIMLEKGTEAHSYEPYTGGQPSPSPDYPQEIKSVVNPTIKVVGKNLLNATLQTTTHNGVTCANNGDGTYTLNGTSTADTDFYIYGAWSTVNNIHLDSQKTYIVKKSGNENIQFYVGIPDVYTTVTSLKDGQIKNQVGISFVICRVLSGSILNNFTIYPQVEEGSASTDFQPYHEQAVALPYTLNAIPVSSGGNVTIDGQQYIADYVDVERGKLVRMVGVTDQDTFETSKWANGSIVIYSQLSNVGTDSAIVTISSKFTANWSAGDEIHHFTQPTGQTLVMVLPKTITTIEQGEEIRAKGFKFYYILVTPIEIDLTTEEITAFKALVTYYPTTNISISSEQLDGYAVFNYPISMENGWNYVKKQLNDNRDYIYDMDIQSAEAYVNSEYAVALTELEV
jgi:hypothetical protein